MCCVRFCEPDFRNPNSVTDMAMVSGSRSTLNPNAPLFIPAAFLQVEDFSPEWWNLVKTSTWFRDYWLGEHQENLEEEDEDDDDIVDLLPDSFDIGGMDGFSVLEPRMDEAALQVLQAEKSQTEKVELPGIETDEKKIVGSINLMKSPKVEPARYPEKAPQCLSPKYSPRRIQQPR